MAGLRRQAAVDIEHYLFEPEEQDLPDFLVLEFSGHEGVSQLAEFDIKLLADEQDIDPADILNKRASLRIWCWQDNDYSRVYHGIISSFQQTGQDEEGNFYQVHMVPLLWRLTLNYQSRIFQEKSIPDIIKEVLEEAGFEQDDYRFSLNGNYLPLTEPPREFCVQYRESDFNFISRLMEEEGIFYFFDYDQNDNKEAMVIADNDGIHSNTSPMSEVRYEKPSGLQSLEAEYIYPMQYRINVIPTDFNLTDFNYDTPQTRLSSVDTATPDTQEGTFVQNDYPGRYGFPDRGTGRTSVRLQEMETGRRVISGAGNCRSFCAGYLFTLTNYPNTELTDKDYLLTRITHHGTQPGIMATDTGTSYNNQFEAIPAPANGIPYRPLRVTPKSRVQGTQTAIVVGQSGEELYMDSKGRAKIEFHWDMKDQNNEKSSCWVRVSHGYAGEKHGIQFHPLVGDEVIVDFLEGDPDKPIIVGRVYNGKNMPPLKPEDRIQNIIRTPYQHELMLDDKATSITLKTGGNEKIEMVDGDESKTDFGNNIKILTADGHFAQLSKGNELNGVLLQTTGRHGIRLDDDHKGIGMMTTGKHRMILDDDDQYILIESTNGNTITIDDSTNIITIHAGDTVAITASTVTIDADTIKASTTGDISLDAAGNINIKAGMNLNIEAGLEATLTGMNTTVEGAIKVTTKALTNAIEGQVLTEVKGLLVKIN